MLMQENSGRYVAGVGVHWYKDDVSRATVLDQTNNDYPEKFILMTEASNGEFFIFNNFLYVRKRTYYTNISVWYSLHRSCSMEYSERYIGIMVTR